LWRQLREANARADAAETELQQLRGPMSTEDAGPVPA
jgi:hypothetical protein